MLGEGIFELLVSNLPQRGELGARPDGARHPAGFAWGRVAVGGFAGDAGGREVDFGGSVGDVVFPQRHSEGAEGGCLNRIHADFQELVVHLGDDFWAGDGKQFVAAFQFRAAEVIC